MKSPRIKDILNKDATRINHLSEIFIKITPEYPLQAHHMLMLEDKDMKGNILDVGAHYCRFPIILKQLDNARKITCLEGSDFCCWIGSTLGKIAGTKLNIVNKLIEEYHFEKEVFDTIVFSNVLEHLENVDECFDWLYKILKKDGMIFLTLPYENHHYDPHHISLFSDKDKLGFINLKKYLEKLPFVVEKFMVFDETKSGKGHNRCKLLGQLDFYIKLKKK